MGWLERLLGLNGGLPDIPEPTPRRLSTGNAQIDQASEVMPFEQRRVIQHLRKKGKLDLSPLRGPTGHYSPEGGMVINTDMLMHPEAEQFPKTLTHEATHALQPEQGLLDRLLNGLRTRDPLPDAKPTGDPYLDNPREREAFAAEQQVRLLRALRARQ